MPLRFRKTIISAERYESAGVFDVDNDGVLDIVSGAWWYKGPDFGRRYPIWQPPAVEEWYDDFSTIPLDIDGDGNMDFVTAGYWGKKMRWLRNPGEGGAKWKVVEFADVGNVETTRAWDIDGDGAVEIVPNVTGGDLEAFRLVRDEQGRGTGEFSRHVLWEGKQGHGLGSGDISGNGRCDFVMRHGWVEAPGDPWTGSWEYHQEFDLGSASVPIIVADVNGDGASDLIVGGAHSYGLWWWEQKREGGVRSWVRHEIDPGNSQYHDMMWIDIDGDGSCELVTGKRYRAHNGKDPGSDDPSGIYYFKWTGEGFAKQVIDYGPPGCGASLGIHFAMADLTGNGLPDIVAPGKDGLFVYQNLGSEVSY